MSHIKRLVLNNGAKKTSQSVWTGKGKQLTKILKPLNSGIFLFRGRQTGGGTGYVRAYDSTNGQELAIQTVTASTPTIFEINLANLPVTVDQKVLFELQLKTDGTGTIHASVATLEMD